MCVTPEFSCENGKKYSICYGASNYIQTLQFTILSLFLQEEALRQKRLASSRSEAASSVTSSNRSEAFSVQAMNPDATALSTTYIYAALVVLVIGIIIGKWIF